MEFSSNIKNHISSVDGFRQTKGVIGGHNQNVFDQIVQEKGLKIVDEVVDPEILGIKKITYQIPSKDRAGNITGYKDKYYEKTIYDPKYFSDERIYALGRQASNQLTPDELVSGSAYFNKVVDGIKFRVYVRDGKVVNFHPQINGE
ncbi:hypothetical protein BSQ33_19345 [Vibrio gazogenes]|uniref:Bacterial EndoU nuclease domain-containing protein n=1 Tax=Vibrio gazogenes TaxID=687 RepID=A0A1Z2SM87_VIBGA|nr:hypothetical protein BSQ33_19345 [Vibrio gazogenes]